ncbi:subtilisin-like proprotein convertase family protein [Flavobacterium sp. HSC-32F16]|uniref:zinc-dependent metalloprotease n=1 Tax=Flavobacterium sp. HSC-32F16 TaxID=2910964 RepID=UPI0020A261A0|nr:zinc-dependent metalloprotease family protein [Flavobacterium sp. HSC-32F16]MCP2028215.1 subtilisin-like proprotein convertase family protein [Flavobacterium sp. HSC-32F16]
MKKQLLFLIFIFCCVELHAQNDDVWQRSSSVSSLKKQADVDDPDKLYYRLNTDFLKAKLSSTTNKQSKNSRSEITIPNSKGILERFQVWESSNFDPQLQAKYPEIRAYEGTGLDDKSAKIHFSFSPKGLQTMVFRADKATEFIEENPDNKTEYVLFSSKSEFSKAKLSCKTTDLVSQNDNTSKTAKTSSNNKVFKTMRLALSCTAEYTAFFGGTKAGALEGMNATLTRVNGILNKDLAVQLILIANSDALIYTDTSTDPYSNASKGTSTDTDGNDFWSKEVQTTITNVIGEGNYDIGHLFGASGGGGNAGCIGCVCVSPSQSNVIGKGSAYTSPSNAIPKGDTFDVDFVVHEIGHQLGANHTFSYDIEGTGVSVEPGSGSTIMGYAGVTDDYDIQDNSDDYFAYASILQIQNNLAGKSCPVSTNITNNPPTIIAGVDFTIPISTPFVLTGTGSGADTLTYTWEENDNATSTSGDNSITYATKPNGPLFRSVAPGSSPVRYMPSFNSVLQNKLTTTWESVSSIARTLNFTLTGRDNGALGNAQTNTDGMVVTVTPSAGPFAVTSQNIDNVSWQQGSYQNITWSVNNTNTLQGSSTVNIKLSTDGGLTFPIILAAATANDGSETVLIPESIEAATNSRILIEPTANIYYALNSKSFAIGYTSTTSCNDYSFGSSFNIPYGTSFTTRNIAVPSSTGTISNVNVSINVTHARFSDLEIQIVSPKGTVVRLFNRGCASTNSTLALQFDDSGSNLQCSTTTSQIVLPIDALSVFNGENPEGNWTLRVRDAVVGSFGTINSAAINICNQTFTLGVDTPVTEEVISYPNPSKGTFAVEFKSQSKAGVQIYVHDILGKTVYFESFEHADNFRKEITLPIGSSSGVYFLTIIDGDKRTVKKIILN